MNAIGLQHLAEIVRDSDDAIIGKTLEGIITSWNGGAERIYGYTAEEAIGRTVAMLVPLDKEDELPEILRKLTRGEGIDHYDTLRVTKDGRLLNISLTVSPIRDASGVIIGASSISRDVTKEKQADSALRDSVRDYKLLMEQASEAILISYPDQPLIEVNHRAREMFGYGQEELLQLQGESTLPKSLGALPPLPDEILAGDIVQSERAVRRKDGTIIVTELSARRLDDGRIVTIARDITDRKNVEEAWRVIEARLYNALALAELSSYEWNPRTGALLWGPDLREIWGIPAGTSIDVDMFLAGVHPDDRENVQAEIDRCSDPAGTGMFIAEFRIVRQPNTEQRWVSARGKTFFAGNVAVHHVGVVQDITDHKRSEETNKQLLAEVQHERGQLHTILGSVPGVVWEAWRQPDSSTQRIDFISDRVETMLGYSVQEWLSTPSFWLQTVHPDDRERAIQETAAQFARGHGGTSESRLVRADGRVIWVESNTTVILDEDGKPIGMRGVDIDITERKEGQEIIQFQAQVLNQVRAAVVATDMEGIITHWNEHAEALFGWKCEEALGQPALSLMVGPADAEVGREIMTQVMAEGVWEGEFTVRRKDGSTFPAYVIDTVIRDQVGGMIGVAGISVDITKRKQAEENLRESEERFRLMFASNPLPMWVYDVESLRFLEVNEAAVERYGYSRDEFLAMTITDIRPSEEIPRLLESLARRRPGPQSSGEWRHQKKDGQIMDVQITSHTFVSGAALSKGAILVVAEDITERKKGEGARLAKEAAEHANRAKNEFLSRMSHELRTPLNAILGFSQILEMDNSSSEQQESVSYILKAGRHLLSLINEVLDIARIEEGNFALSIEPVLVSDALQECLRMVQPLAARRNIEVRAVMTYMDNLYVNADNQRLRQVLLNVLANAIKYNREDGVVSVSCSVLGNEATGAERSPDPKSPEALRPSARVRIKVSDTGYGLSPDQLARLFTPFERLGAEQRDIEGTGLGLALSRHLVEAMGGAIGAESELDIGSAFWVDLPQADEPLPAHEPIVPGPQADSQEGEHVRTLLYIEDNLSNLRLIESILKKRIGIRLMTAMQGQIGLDMAYEHRPDLILLDLHLPDMTGHEVLRRLKRDPRTAMIPVVILSADANPRQVETLLADGAWEYLSKPFDVKRLLKVLQESQIPSLRAISI